MSEAVWLCEICGTRRDAIRPGEPCTGCGCARWGVALVFEEEADAPIIAGDCPGFGADPVVVS